MTKSSQKDEEFYSNIDNNNIHVCILNDQNKCLIIKF